MQVVLHSGRGERELDIALRSAGATLRDLVHAAGEQPGESIIVGERLVPVSCLVSDSGLHDGAHLYLPLAATRAHGGPGSGPVPRRPAARRPQLQLVVVAGPAAGTMFPIRPGRSTIGRDSTNSIRLPHPTVSRHHSELHVDPAGRASLLDVGGANRVVVDGRRIPVRQPVELTPGAVVEIGAFAVVVRKSSNDDHPRGGAIEGRIGPLGTIAFNRPPRTMTGSPSEQLSVPREPTEATRPDLNVTTIVGPILFAVVLIAITRNPAFALFALLSPVLAVGLWLEGKRRVGKKNADAQASYQAELQELSDRIQAANGKDTDLLRARCPDPAEVLRRAALPSVRLWERRPHHDDHLSLYVGIADVAWQPRLTNTSPALPLALAALPESTHLRSAPVTAELANGGVVGVVGDRTSALALARSLVCQAAVHHGPADLTIGVFVDTGRAPEWDWVKWLPHTLDAGGNSGARLLGEGREQCDALISQLTAGAGGSGVLAVIDADTFTEGKEAPARTLLRNERRGQPGASPPPARVSGIVIASTRDRLPSMCTTVVDTDADATAIVRLPLTGGEVPEVLTAGLSTDSARACARDLARFEDPELHLPGGDLPDLVRLLPLLGLASVDAESVRKKWRQGRPAHPSAPLGVKENGLFTLDLVADGPHGLIGGTTGSGKSELLRTLVASLATCTDPRYLTFVLIDYKGGAAFDQCARLPHTVGMVTDLDDQLAERALTALSAELHHRERQLRDVRADNILEYLKLELAEPMPRLVVVIDEFETMAKELPEFMASLIDIAKRGRTLGVHMILATQRPSAAVSDSIRANTDLKIALRVQDAQDSIDVINVRSAAEIHRDRKGRAYARLGPQDLTAIQTALITCTTAEGTDVPVTVTPFVFGPAQEAPAGPTRSGDQLPTDDPTTRTDLARLVDAIVDATDLEQIPPPRRPWPEPLPKVLPLATLAITDASDGFVATVAMADDPRRQAQYPVGWKAAEGNLWLFGIPGSGTTTTLLSIALALASTHGPETLELQVFDFGVGDLAALESLPQTGTVVLAGDRERQMRLMRYLIAELDRRRLGGPTARSRRLVVLVDNFAAMRAAYTDVSGVELLDQLARVVADGQSVGISFAMSADRINTVPGAFAAPQRWLFRLADAYDYTGVGIDKQNRPAEVAGRAVDAQSGLHIQVGLPAPSAAADGAARYPNAVRVAPTIGVLPAEISFPDLDATATVTTHPWTIPVGMSETDLGPAALQLYEGEHALVAGPARSGKTTALWTIAAACRAGGRSMHIAGMGGRRSTLRNCPDLARYAGTPGEAATLLAQLRTVAGPVVLLIDDAESFDDTDAAIATLLAADLPELHVVAAANNDALRSLYSHWTKAVRRSKIGVLLRPNIDVDGDLVGTTLPRRSPVTLTGAGRGYLVSNGDIRVIQVAQP